MIERLRREPVAVAAFCTALVALLLALDVIEPELAAAATGMIAAGLVVVRSVVTPVVTAVEKVAAAVEATTGTVTGLLDDEDGRARATTVLPVCFLAGMLAGACAENNDTLLTGASGVILLTVLAIVVVRIIHKRKDKNR